MATALPTAKQLGAVQVAPSMGVATYRGETGHEGDVGRGMVATAGIMDRATDHLIKAQDEFDQIQAEDRYNKYQEKLNEIANDPNNGWRTAKGENAFKGDFQKRYTEQFETVRKEMMGSLDTENAKRRFGQLANAAAMRSRAQLYEHSARERVAYEAKVYDDTIALEKDNAWRSFGDDEAFNNTLGRVRAVTESFARKWSVGADESTVKRAVQEAESGMWAHRIQAALSAGDAPLAKELLGKASGALTTKDKLALDAKVKPMVRLSKAVSAVDEVFAKMVSPDLNAPFPTAQIDAELRRRFADDPEQLTAARQEADYRRRTMADAQKEQNTANMAGVLQAAYEKRAPMSQIMQSDDYQKLSGEQKARFISSYQSYLHTLDAREAARANRALSNEQREALRRKRLGEDAAHSILLHDETVRALDDSSINNFALEYGSEPALILKQRRDQLNKPIGGKLTMEEFKPILSEYIPAEDAKLLSGSRKLNEKEQAKKASYGRALYRINTEIQERATQKRAPLDLDEKAAIARRVLSEKIHIDYGWSSLSDIFSSDVETIPALVPEVGGQRETYAKRGEAKLEDIPAKTRRVYAGILRKEMKLGNQPDAAVLEQYRRQVQRAHALAMMGASEQQIEDVLLGNIE